MASLPETPQWEDGIYQIEVSDPVLGGPDGISNRQAKQLASRTSYLKQKVEKSGTDLAAHIAAPDPHAQYAPKTSPAFTGTPTAPTPANNDNSKKLATTEFVAKVLTALAGSAPETLDTLKKLADALGNDPNFAATVLNTLAEKLAKDQNGADIADPALFVKNLGLGEGSALPTGVPIPWPSAMPPAGWLKCNGAAFTATQHPKLALAYPALRLPDLRGEFIRGWSDGGGVDSGRTLLSLQAGMLEKHRHFIVANTAYEETGEWDIGVIRRAAYRQGRGLDASSTGGSLIPTPTLHSKGRVGNTGGAETRPRNVAFNYIVRAA